MPSAASQKGTSRAKKPPKIKPLTEFITASKYLEAAELKPVAPSFKEFDWDDIHHADCLMTGAFLILRPDGTGRFGSFVQTNDSTDVWLVRGLALIDNHGLELWRIPQFNGPEMTVDDHVYAFFKEDIFFPAHLWPSINSINMIHHC